MNTLEQKRADNAWKQSEKFRKEHEKVVKSMPMQIIRCGLMQTVAYLESKDETHKKVGEALRTWLNQQYDEISPNFNEFMNDLLNIDSQRYQNLTTEALAWLKWLRYMASARNKSKPSS